MDVVELSSEFDRLVASGDELRKHLRREIVSNQGKPVRIIDPKFEDVLRWVAIARALNTIAFGRDSSELQRWNELQRLHDDRLSGADPIDYLDKCEIFSVRLSESIEMLTEYGVYVRHLTEYSDGEVPAGGEHHRVFIIHGHDHVNLLRLKELLIVRFGLLPVVMMDVPAQGRTLIEKFEAEAASCTFAFALLTPDDEVRTPNGEHTQARPNVVFELGWLYARLGRERVVVLLRRGTRLHSDLDGLERYEFSEDIREHALKIEDELIRAGLIKPHQSSRKQGGSR
jgi:hypothetical protein